MPDKIIKIATINKKGDVYCFHSKPIGQGKWIKKTWPPGSTLARIKNCTKRGYGIVASNAKAQHITGVAVPEN